jgi:hypothetical protein
MSLPNIDTSIDNGLQLYGMDEISRFDFDHSPEHVQYYGNVVYGFEYGSNHTFYDLMDPSHPKLVAGLVFEEYEYYLFQMTHQNNDYTKIFLLLGPFTDQNSHLHHHIKMIDISHAQEPAYFHNYSIPQKLKKKDEYTGNSYEEEISWDYSCSRYTDDGLLFMPFTLATHYFSKKQIVYEGGFSVFSINMKDGIMELNQCWTLLGESAISYTSSELQPQNSNNGEEKCHYCAALLSIRIMRLNAGTQWLMSSGSDIALTQANFSNGTITCRKEWEQTIHILAPDDQAAMDCSDPNDPDCHIAHEYCCHL